MSMATYRDITKDEIASISSCNMKEGRYVKYNSVKSINSMVDSNDYYYSWLYNVKLWDI